MPDDGILSGPIDLDAPRHKLTKDRASVRSALPARAAAGIDRWPDVPKGQPWKDGVCRALGVGDPGAFWKRLLGSVRTYADLEAPLVGAVEQLIDFVTT